MSEISVLRLNLLRGGYLLIAVGLGCTLWPALLDPAKNWELTHGVVGSMLGAMSLLAILGLRYPLRMLPILLFELTWKTLWLVRMALPLWWADRMDADTAETAAECLVAVVLLALIPWDYVLRQYVTRAGDSWRGASLAPAANTRP